MDFDWYNLFNEAEFLESGLVSRTIEGDFEDQGSKTILITKGINVGVQVDDQFLIVNFNNENPYIWENYAVFKDEDDNVWIGFGVEEE